jgi:hypothetical protein
MHIINSSYLSSQLSMRNADFNRKCHNYCLTHAIELEEYRTNDTAKITYDLPLTLAINIVSNGHSNNANKSRIIDELTKKLGDTRTDADFPLQVLQQLFNRLEIQVLDNYSVHQFTVPIYVPSMRLIVDLAEDVIEEREFAIKLAMPKDVTTIYIRTHESVSTPLAEVMHHILTYSTNRAM